MRNFDYYNPVKILFGKGKIAEIAKWIPKGMKVMMTYGGGSIKKNGVYEQVMDALQGFDIVEFGGIEPNPKYETLMRAVELAKQENVGFLLAVGGGSVIDGTKFIAAATCFEGNEPWDIVAKGARVNAALPLGAVLTLPATGSEMNSGGVITRQSTLEKLAFNSRHVFPKFSVLDPMVTYSLPMKQVANGVVDTFVHVMEQYYTFPEQAEIQDRFSESILKTLIELGPKLIHAEKPNYEDRANFMWAATMGLNGFIAMGVTQDWATHMIGHELTALHGLTHGATLAIVFPGTLRTLRKQKEGKILQYGERVWGINSGTTEERVSQAIEKTEQFFQSLGLSTRLSQEKIGDTTITEIENRFNERNAAFGEAKNVTGSVAREILESCK